MSCWPSCHHRKVNFNSNLVFFTCLILNSSFFLPFIKSCGVVEPWAAVVIGFFAGVFFLGSSLLLLHLRLDDAVDAIPVHLSGGIWGAISTGLFASPTGLRRYYDVDVAEHVGLFYSGKGNLLGSQIVGCLIIITWVSVIMFPFFVILNYLGMLRADSLDEIVGLDVSYHGWTPAIVDDVTQRDLDAYAKQAKIRNRFSRHSIEDDQQDNEGVDLLQAVREDTL